MSAQPSSPLPTLRAMSPQDIAAIMAIEHQCYPFPWTPGIFRDCMRVGYRCVVLEHEERIIGYGVLSAAAGESHILNLSIHPQAQRRGYGRALLDRLIADARTLGADMISLEVRPSNTIARHLYQRAGFNEVGRRRHYYPAAQGREDALILARALGDGDTTHLKI